MARGNDEAFNPKRKPARPPEGWSNAFPNGVPAESGPEPKSQEDLAALFDRVDKLAGYGKVQKKYGYTQKPIDDWGLDWPED